MKITFRDLKSGKQFEALVYTDKDGKKAFLAPLWVKSTPDLWEVISSDWQWRRNENSYMS